MADHTLSLHDCLLIFSSYSPRSHRILSFRLFIQLNCVIVGAVVGITILLVVVAVVGKPTAVLLSVRVNPIQYCVLYDIALEMKFKR